MHGEMPQLWARAFTIEAVANFDLRNSREESILSRKDYKQHDERVVSLV